MKMRCPGKSLFYLLSLSLVVTACQKNQDTPDPVIPPPTVDSTQLVKSISKSWDDGSTISTITENYSYDTINRKLTLNLVCSGQSATEIYPSGTKKEISYNTDKLVTHVDIIYPPGTDPDMYFYASSDVVYDTDGIIKKLTTTTLNGDIQETVFNKQLTGSGYQLSWSFDDGAMTVQRRAAFDNAGNNESNSVIYPDGSFSTDSLVYDGDKNIVQVYTKTQDSTYLHYDFKSRQQGGDQLYKQRQLIMNGLANIPFMDIDYNGTVELFGVLSLTISNENWQYSRHPYQAASVFNSYQNQVIDLTSSFESIVKTGWLNSGHSRRILPIYPLILKSVIINRHKLNNVQCKSIFCFNFS